MSSQSRGAHTVPQPAAQFGNEHESQRLPLRPRQDGEEADVSGQGRVQSNAKSVEGGGNDQQPSDLPVSLKDVRSGFEGRPVVTSS